MEMSRNKSGLEWLWPGLTGDIKIIEWIFKKYVVF
jgi:hypothetical protein